MHQLKDFPVYKEAPISSLVPYAKNSRTHSADQIDKIAASIKEFGFLAPVVTDGKNGIVAGHGRVMAAQSLGMETVPTVDAAHLTAKQKQAYVLADNRLALDAGWDEALLRSELINLDAEGFDITLTGFNPDELSNILNGMEFQAGTEEDQGKLDELAPKIIECPHCNKKFDMRLHEQR